jgi:hypothetical protein
MSEYPLTVQQILTIINSQLEIERLLEAHAHLESENIKARYCSAQCVSLADVLRLQRIDKDIALYRKENEDLMIDRARLQECEERMRQLGGEHPTFHVINEERCLARVSYTTRNGNGHFDTLLSDVIIRQCRRQLPLPILMTQEEWDNPFLDL